MYYRGKGFHMMVMWLVMVVCCGLSFFIAWMVDAKDDLYWLLYGCIGGAVLGFFVTMSLDHWLEMRWQRTQIERFYHWFDIIFAFVSISLILMLLILRWYSVS